MMRTNKWSDLTAKQQRAIQLVGVLQFGLLVSALWDIWHRPVDEINGDRRLWTLALFVNFVGPIAYFVFGRNRCC